MLTGVVLFTTSVPLLARTTGKPRSENGYKPRQAVWRPFSGTRRKTAGGKQRLRNGDRVISVGLSGCMSLSTLLLLLPFDWSGHTPLSCLRIDQAALNQQGGEPFRRREGTLRHAVHQATFNEEVSKSSPPL